MVCTSCHKALGGGPGGQRDRRVPRAEPRACSRPPRRPASGVRVHQRVRVVRQARAPGQEAARPRRRRAVRRVRLAVLRHPRCRARQRLEVARGGARRRGRGIVAPCRMIRRAASIRCAPSSARSIARSSTLVAKRQAVAQQIGQVKRDAGIPTRDFRQERDVVERARAAAVAHGLSPALGEELILALIRGSLTVQEKDTVAASGEGSGRRALVIGGARPHGPLVRALPRRAGLHRRGRRSGRRPGRATATGARVDARSRARSSSRRRCRRPREILEAMAAEPPTRRGVRRRLAEEPAAQGARTRCAPPAGASRSVHPMFGPDTELLSGRHVIFVDVGAPEATAAARALFEPTMATLVEMDLESHDRLIAYVLGLSHALNIAFFTALAESGEAAPRLATLSSTTFDAQLGVAGEGRRREPRSLLRDPDAQRLRHRVARGAALRGRAAALRRARRTTSRASAR